MFDLINFATIARYQSFLIHNGYLIKEFILKHIMIDLDQRQEQFYSALWIIQLYSLCILPSILQNIQLNIRFNVQVYWYIKREMVEKWNGERIRNTPNLYHNGHINITLVSINAKNGRSILYYHCVWYFQHKWCKAQVAVYPKMHASMFNECNRKLWDKLNKLIEWEDFAIKFCTHTHTHTLSR